MSYTFQFGKFKLSMLESNDFQHEKSKEQESVTWHERGNSRWESDQPQRDSSIRDAPLGVEYYPRAGELTGRNMLVRQ